jgi:hypothetical protein
MNPLSRREFLKLGAAGMGALLLSKTKAASASYFNLDDFPKSDKLGRLFHTFDIKSKPDVESSTVQTLFEDNVVNLYRDVLGTGDSRGFRSKTWYETDGGYIYAPNVQPVKNLINQPLSVLPTYGAQPGFWAEVTVPYVDLQLAGENPQSPLLVEIMENKQTPRFYYSQVLWIDNLKTNDNGDVIYHVLEKHGSYGDTFWADGKAFKPLTPEDLAPINPDVADKKIIVNLNQQSISCYEGSNEILYAVVSTGAKDYSGNYVEAWATPTGDYFAVNRKFISLHMGGEQKLRGMKISRYLTPQYLPMAASLSIPHTGIMPMAMECLTAASI